MIGTRGRGYAEKKWVRAEAQRRREAAERRRPFARSHDASTAAMPDKAASPQALLHFLSLRLCASARENPSFLLSNSASSRLLVNQKGAEA